MVALPPGTILQLMYLRGRLRRWQGSFIEIGPGRGEITQRLLAMGWRGTVYDLDAETVAHLRQRFQAEVADARLQIVHGDFTAGTRDAPSADLVISCMVMEHMDDATQQRYLAAAKAVLRPGGRLVGFVPGSPSHWGIEDEIAGHQRRYTRESLYSLAAENGWCIEHLTGLTYPVSNLLLPVSNWLVRRSEASKLVLDELERTKQSGRRDVAFKTAFPRPMNLLLNEWTMFPLHLLQRVFRHANGALVLYFEAVPGRPESV